MFSWSQGRMSWKTQFLICSVTKNLLLFTKFKSYGNIAGYQELICQSQIGHFFLVIHCQQRRWPQGTSTKQNGSCLHFLHNRNARSLWFSLMSPFTCWDVSSEIKWLLWIFVIKFFVFTLTNLKMSKRVIPVIVCN